MFSENYVCKKEVDWSLLMEGITLPQENQVVFGQITGRFLKRGETKDITLYLDGKSYKAKIVNVNNPVEKRKNDAFQIRYTRDGELSKALQFYFSKSYNYIKAIRDSREPGERRKIRVPEDYKEYLAIYTTEYDDSYILDTIIADDIAALRKAVDYRNEKSIETFFNYNVDDIDTGFYCSSGFNKIRKLNRSIGDNLKLLYNYRCQICGKPIGDKYGSNVVESHHIDYFVSSLNNDSSNQIIVCPNHHSIIHDVNPVFRRNDLSYVYENGYIGKLVLNLHL